MKGLRKSLISRGKWRAVRRQYSVADRKILIHHLWMREQSLSLPIVAVVILISWNILLAPRMASKSPSVTNTFWHIHVIPKSSEYYYTWYTFWHQLIHSSFIYLHLIYSGIPFLLVNIGASSTLWNVSSIQNTLLLLQQLF